MCSMLTRNCIYCGKKISYYVGDINICDKCQMEAINPKRKPMDRDFPADWTLDVKNAKAREMGLSYGKFVALVHDGTLNIKELTKPIDIKSGRRKVVRHVKKY